MTTRLTILIVAALAAQGQSAWADDADNPRFEGTGNGRTAVFETDGPWMLDWRTRSETLLPKNFELRLHDGSGEFLGTIAQLEGTGSGLKLFETGGAYQIAIVASNVIWELDISDVGAEKAAEIKRLSKGEPSLEDRSKQTMRLVPEGSFSSWRPEGNNALLLFDDGEIGWRATCANGCTGLADATALSFVTPARGGLDQYDSILLDDGTRCYFDRVTPARLN